MVRGNRVLQRYVARHRLKCFQNMGHITEGNHEAALGANNPATCDGNFTRIRSGERGSSVEDLLDRLRMTNKRKMSLDVSPDKANSPAFDYLVQRMF